MSFTVIVTYCFEKYYKFYLFFASSFEISSLCLAVSEGKLSSEEYLPYRKWNTLKFKNYEVISLIAG